MNIFETWVKQFSKQDRKSSKHIKNINSIPLQSKSSISNKSQSKQKDKA